MKETEHDNIKDILEEKRIDALNESNTPRTDGFCARQNRNDTPTPKIGDKVKIKHNAILGNTLGTISHIYTGRRELLYGIQLDQGGVSNLYGFQIEPYLYAEVALDDRPTESEIADVYNSIRCAWGQCETIYGAGAETIAKVLNHWVKCGKELTAAREELEQTKEIYREKVLELINHTSERMRLEEQRDRLAAALSKMISICSCKTEDIDTVNEIRDFVDTITKPSNP